MSENLINSTNFKVMKSLYDAGAQGDIGAFLNLLDPELVVYEPSFLPYGGVIRGRDAFMKIIPSISQYISLADIEVENIFIEGDLGIAVIKTKSLAGEPILMAEKARIKNGRIVELTIFINEAGSLLAKP